MRKIMLLKVGIMIFLAFAFMFSSYAATVSHSASELTPGSFAVGNYTFQDSLFITDSLGIGTSSPNATLHVVPSSGTALELGRIIGNPNIKSSDSYLIMDSAGNATALNWYVSDDVILAYGGGNVGIGTDNSTAKLEIKSDDYEDFIVLDRTGIQYVDEKIYISPSYGATNITHLHFNIGSANTVMTLTEEGKVGIGTTNPSYDLQINGNLSVDNVVKIYDTGNIGLGPDILFNLNGLMAAENGLYINIDSDNNNADNTGVYIGKNSDSTTGVTNLYSFNENGNFDIETGRLYVGSLSTSPGSTTLCWDNSGGSYVGTCSSTREKKDNITDLSLGLNDLMKLKPREFNWKATGEKDIGFIADEVENVSELLPIYTDGNLTGVKYRHMVSLLTKSIQEQQEMIHSIQDENKLFKEVIQRQEINTYYLENQNEFLKQALCEEFPDKTICQD